LGRQILQEKRAETNNVDLVAASLEQGNQGGRSETEKSETEKLTNSNLTPSIDVGSQETHAKNSDKWSGDLDVWRELRSACILTNEQNKIISSKQIGTASWTPSTEQCPDLIDSSEKNKQHKGRHK
jgi:hypothetical protein